MCKWLVFICFELLISISWGQSFTVHHISVPEGLPSSEVYEVFQDSKGFIWFATDNGVVRFDGKEMETLHVKDGLTDPVVFSFHEDKEGKIWFRTFSGKLCYYEDGKIKSYKYNKLLISLLKGSYITHLFFENGELWFSAGAVIGKIDSKGIFYEDTSICKSSFHYKSIGKSVIIGYKGSLPITSININDKKFQFTSPIKEANTTVFICSVIWRSRIYLASSNRIFECDGKSIIEVFNSSAEIISLSKDAGDNLWVGYMGHGAERFSDRFFKKPWSPSFLKKRSVTKVLQDQEGGIWITTLEKGVYYIPNILIEHRSFPNDIKVISVLATPNYVVVGNNIGGVYAFHPYSKTLLWKRFFDENIQINDLFYQNNKLLISGNGKVYIMDKNFVTTSIPKIFVTSFSKGKDGVIWGVGANKISKYDKDGKLLCIRYIKDRYRKILFDNASFYLALRSGLQILDNDLNNFTSIEKLSDFKISQFTSLNDSTLLISTIGRGFLLFNKKSWEYTQFDSRNNFIANNVYAVVKNDSMLWLGTEKGVISTYIKSLLKGDFSFNHITKRSGLRSDKINFLASTNKDLWVFSDEGISIVPYNNTQFSNKAPKLYFKSFRVNNKQVELKDNIELNYDENNIQITFGYISFNNQNIITRFRLDSKDPWIKSNERTLQLASLSPGDYKLELEYSVDNINWVCSNHPFSILINPPWWKRWYVELGAVIILLSLIYIYFKNQLMIYKQRDQYHKVVNEYQQKLIHSEIETLERERSRIAKDLHDGVGTNLTAIKLSVGQLLKSYNDSEADKVDDQFQNTIKEIKEIIYALTPPGLERYGLITGLENYIQKLNETVPVRIELNSFGEKTFDTHLTVLVFRVIQELISNSLKHAHAKDITIHISSFDDLLNVVYEDNGIGFDKELIEKGLGLDNIEARIQSVNGNVTFESGKFGVSYSIDIPIKP